VQAADAPHWHLPVAEQLSALSALHAMHDPPPDPQFATVGGSTHAAPEQQPEGQDTELQTQTPPEHMSPTEHCGPAPHLHPPARQPSAWMPQFVHAPPPVPHAEGVGGDVQVDPEQQPEEQFDELHPLQAPALHVCGLGHIAHAAPPEPQSPGVLPGSHLLLASQHPIGHELAVHLQLPPEHAWPGAQAPPAPHVQVPAAEQPSAVLPQLTHAPPLVPHADVVGGVVQVDPEQQPLGHDPESQTHTPPLHTWPAPHAPPIPHEHAPEGEQLSAFVVSQVTQPAPFVPQLESDDALHVLPEQQPPGHEVALQTHAPATHSSPAPQGTPDPQLQAPLAEHVSAVKALHDVQATPATPHVVNDDGLHVEPEQQPAAQFVDVHPLQVPEEVQVCGLGHDWHAPPPLPQALVVSPFWHVPVPSQQPVEQEVALQRHLPPEQI